MSQSMRYVLVTGTNGGLGQGICTRLIDDFLRTQPSSASLTLIFTTRSPRKSNETLASFKAHLAQHHPSSSHARIHFRPESLELTSLLSVRALSRTLLASDIPYINTIILNAGIGGWAGVDWFTAFPDILLDIVNNTTWPKYKIGIAGLVTERQFPDRPDADAGTSKSTGLGSQGAEPVLGQIFCANVFGHYMLVHWLMPLLRACEVAEPGRIVWVSSIEPRDRSLNEDDIMGLRTREGYEASKRLTDLLALTFDGEATRLEVSGFIDLDKDTDNKRRNPNSVPTMHIAHPGVCTTSIMSMYWIITYFYVLGVYMARWAGSPWAVGSTYVAALSFTWLTLAPAAEINEREASYGKGGRVKWGTAVTRLGSATSRPTEVEGWGVNGCGDSFVKTWWGGGYGRIPGAKEATREDVSEFHALGQRLWKVMEELRVQWEGRIVAFERK